MCKLYLFYNYHHVRQCHDPRKLMLRSFKRSSIVTQSHLPFKVWKWKRLFWQRYDSKRSDGSNNSICKHLFQTLFSFFSHSHRLCWGHHVVMVSHTHHSIFWMSTKPCLIRYDMIHMIWVKIMTHFGWVVKTTFFRIWVRQKQDFKWMLNNQAIPNWDRMSNF